MSDTLIGASCTCSASFLNQGSKCRTWRSLSHAAKTNVLASAPMLHRLRINDMVLCFRLTGMCNGLLDFQLQSNLKPLYQQAHTQGSETTEVPVSKNNRAPPKQRAALPRALQHQICSRGRAQFVEAAGTRSFITACDGLSDPPGSPLLCRPVGLVGNLKVYRRLDSDITRVSTAQVHNA